MRRTSAISEFRRRHLKALAALFVQVFQLAEKAGLVKLGHVALDGTKIKANASKHKAMSYERMKKREAELEAEVDRWLKAAEAADREEDKLYGKQRGDEMPDWVADKQKRLEKIRQAKAELEAEAKAAAEEEMRRRDKAEEQRKAEGRKKNGKTPAPPKTEPEGKAQRNFTDPGSRILKTKDGYIQGYNAQAAVGPDHRGPEPDAQHERPGPTRAAHRRDQGQSRPQAKGSLSRCRLLQRDKSCRLGRARGRRLPRYRARQAPCPRQTQNYRTARPGDAVQAEASGTTNPIQAQKASRRAGVRTDQTGKRVQAIPAARHRESESRMGADLHRPQPHQARPSGMNRLSFSQHPYAGAIWTGS